ncbi:MAG: molybdopterin-dependent oxidoreductase [Vicinamibacterales bacterium]
MDRRTFIKLTAITGTSAGIAACGVPEHQIIRFVPDEELVPGIAEWKPSVCPLCSAGCGLTVRTMMADVDVTKDGQQGVVRKSVAKKLEGLGEHPVSRGGLCARGQAAIQVTYHPDRIAQPLKRKGAKGSGEFEPITWDAAVAELVGKLDGLASSDNQKALAIITGGRRSHRRLLLEQFAAKYGAPAPVVYELFSDDLLRRANEMSFGLAQLPTFDLGNAHFVIAFGADFLGTWNAPVSHAAAYGDMRQGRAGIRGAFVQVEARMTPTGASADEWVAAKPGTEGVLALGLAHVLLRDKLRTPANGRAGALIDGWAAGLPDYAPDRVAAVSGVSAKKVERLAHELAERAPSVAIVGGVPLAQSNGLFTALAVNALNELLGAVGQKGGVSFTPQLSRPAAAPRTSLAQWAAGVVPQVLIVDEANPVFAAPRAFKVKDAIAKVPFLVSFAQFVDETSAMADLILPDHSFLESWVDALPESGAQQAVVSVAGPVMKPLFDTKATGDVLLEVAGKLAKPVDLGATSYDAFVKAALAPLGDEAWSTAQKQAGWWGELPKGAAAQPAAADAKAAPVKFTEPAYNGDATEYPFQFLPYPTATFYDGSLAHLPWLQELPDPMSSAMWSSWVELNPKTAERLGIALGDVVEITSSAGALKAPAFINPALSPDIIAMPVGQGHTNYTRYATGRGQNPIDILAPVVHEETGTLAWAATRVKAARVSEPDGKLIMFSARGELREEPHEGKVR